MKRILSDTRDPRTCPIDEMVIRDTPYDKIYGTVYDAAQGENQEVPDNNIVLLQDDDVSGVSGN